MTMVSPPGNFAQAPTNYMACQVLSVKHWKSTIFSFMLTRDRSFRFRKGQFVMLGLMVGDKPLMRAYSIASADYEDVVEFLSIKIPDGPLTSRLSALRQGDTVLLGRKTTGTLLLDNVKSGRNLYLLSTRAGLAPFIGLTKSPEIYKRYDRVILSHICRQVGELAYSDWLRVGLIADEYLGDDARGKLLYYPSVTRESYHTTGRITDNITNGRFFGI